MVISHDGSTQWLIFEQINLTMEMDMEGSL